MLHDVFLSYSSKDKQAADAAREVLERNNIHVWMAPRDILPGLGWGASIVEAINTARLMVLVFSSNANTSPQIEREVERAINKGLPIIPFRIEDVEPSHALEYFISAAHWLDAFTKPMEQHLDRLAEVVRRVIEVKYGKDGASNEAEEDTPRWEQTAKADAAYGEQSAPQQRLREVSATLKGDDTRVCRDVNTVEREELELNKIVSSLMREVLTLAREVCILIAFIVTIINAHFIGICLLEKHLPYLIFKINPLSIGIQGRLLLEFDNKKLLYMSALLTIIELIASHVFRIDKRVAPLSLLVAVLFSISLFIFIAPGMFFSVVIKLLFVK